MVNFHTISKMCGCVISWLLQTITGRSIGSASCFSWQKARIKSSSHLWFCSYERYKIHTHNTAVSCPGEHISHLNEKSLLKALGFGWQPAFIWLETLIWSLVLHVVKNEKITTGTGIKHMLEFLTGNLYPFYWQLNNSKNVAVLSIPTSMSYFSQVLGGKCTVVLCGSGVYFLIIQFFTHMNLYLHSQYPNDAQDGILTLALWGHHIKMWQIARLPVQRDMPFHFKY